MCGIIGFIGNGNYNIVRSMTDAIKHRGPDESGYYYKDNIGIGHRRLIIIDLVSGQQPMFNEDKNLVLTYNGEIYNYRSIKKELEKYGYKFKTNCDTEVVIYAYEKWGPACLKKFNGMFAFAIVHLKEKKVFLARDRFGQKPLYFYKKNNLFMFSSELTSFKYHPEFENEIDINSFQKYLFYEYIPAPYSIYKNTYKLEAGHYAIYKDNDLKTEQYYNIVFDDKKYLKISESEVENEFINKLKKSLKLRLLSDVPLGVFLSGGLDSSTIVSLLSEITDIKKVKTFSIGFKEKSFDESIYSKQVANYFGTEHYEEELTASKIQSIIPEIFTRLDEPLADNSIIPTYLLSKFTRKYVRTALGGDGGDELLAGYDPFCAHYIFRNLRFSEKILGSAQKIIEKIIPVSDKNMGLQFKILHTLKGLNQIPEYRNEFWMASFLPEDQKKILNSSINLNEVKILEPIKKMNLSGLNLIQKIIYVYTKLYLQNDILTKVDRASMLNSFEVRAPFLDFEFADFVNNLDNKYKIKFNNRKIILKKIMKNRLPENIINRPKKGFGVPLGKWFKNELKDIVYDTLLSDAVKRDGLFNVSYIKKMLNDHSSGKKDYRKKIWTCLTFQMWRNYNI